MSRHNTNRAISESERGADVEWLALARRAVMYVARDSTDFTAEEVWAVLSRFAPPREKRALGGVFRRLKGEGRIAPTGEYRLAQRPESHSRPLTVWAQVREVSE